MAKLTFPTQAEQAVAAFQNARKTTSLATICRRLGAQVDKNWDMLHVVTTYLFDDDTSIEVRGTGRNHQVTVHLP